MARIVIVDPLLSRSHHGLTGSEFGPGHDVIEPDSWAVADVAAVARDADVLLTAVRPVTAELIARTPRLGLVAKPGAGLDNIDIEAATCRGVLVCNVPGARGQAVAEHAAWAILALAKRVPPRPASGAPALPLDLAGRTLGLVGLGDIGGRIARFAAAMGMQVVAATPSRTNRAGVDVEFTDLATVHSQCDVLVLCAPLTPSTRGLLNRTRLEEMRTDAMVVNVARGPLVVTADLLAVLEAGHLHGAALDVTDPEPLPAEHPLRALPNVLITPHVAGRTARAQRAALAVLVRNVAAFLAGEPPPDAVNAEAVGRRPR